MKKKISMILGLVLILFVLTGCIPKNDHVGKPAAHSYKDGYYDRNYYYR